MNNNNGIILDSSSNYNNLIGNNASNNNNGIRLVSSSFNNLTGNKASNNYFGIYLVSSSNYNNLKDNKASNNYYGIYLVSSNNSNLTDNNVLNNNYHGIYLDSSGNNNLMNNIIQKPFSQQGLLVTGTILQNFRNKITTSNTVNGMPIMYIDGVYTPCSNDSVFSLGGSYSQITFVGCDNVTLQDTSVIDTITLAFTTNSTVKNSNSTGSKYGIYLSSSGNNNLTNNNAMNNDGSGIYLSSSSNNNLTSNNALNNYGGSGIALSSSSNYNKLTNNNANLNNYFGIYLSSSSNNNNLKGNNANLNHISGYVLTNSNNNMLSYNNAYSNTNIGIQLDSSSNNMIYNNIFNNTNNFYFTGSNINTWNNSRQSGINIIGGSYLGGNFWANPNGIGLSQTCTDAKRDGICDMNYTLASGNVDYLPLTIPAGYSYIYGTVSNDSIEIAGVTVATNTSFNTSTDATGSYSLLVLAGTYKLIATSEPRFYPNNSVTVTVAARMSIVQDIELVKKQTGNITGSVTRCCTSG